MNHRESAELLAKVIPLMERPENWYTPAAREGRGFVGNHTLTWRVAGLGGLLKVDATDTHPAFVVGETVVEDSRFVTWTMPIAHGADRASIIAAVRLAVSRLYDGPQEAPAAVSSLPKVALCTERGCSETRTEGQLCASHARRAETYAREAMAACVRREWDRHAELQEQMVRREPVGGGSINLAKACADGSAIDEALARARHSVPEVKVTILDGLKHCARCGVAHSKVFACEACWWLFLRRAGGTKAGIGGSHQETQQRFAEWARANPVASAAPQGIVRRDYEAALMGTDPAGIRAAEAYAFAISAPPKLVPQGLLLAVRAIIGSPHSEGLLAGGLGINAWYKVAPGISPSDVGKTVFLKGGRLELAESLPPRPGTAGRCKTPRCSRKPAAGLAWADGQWCEIHQLEARSEAFTRETMGGPEPTGEEQLRLRQKIDAKIPEFSSLVASGGMGGSGAAG